jgi:hypothetical protein
MARSNAEAVRDEIFRAFTRANLEPRKIPGAKPLTYVFLYGVVRSIPPEEREKEFGVAIDLLHKLGYTLRSRDDFKEVAVFFKKFQGAIGQSNTEFIGVTVEGAGRVADVTVVSLGDRLPRTASPEKSDMRLRSALIRLAHSKPELRGELLPLIRKTGL